MKSFLLLCALILPAVILTVDRGSNILAWAEEDDVDDEMVDVEGEGDESSIVDEGGDEDGAQPTASPDADTTILFTRPVAPSASGNLELPAGNLVEFLVGFTNKGNQDFVLETLEASFRYPMDFTFYIQNFSTIAYNRVVKPNHEATLAYSFIPAEAFAGRPFGLNINLNYRDLAGSIFQEAVYNETVQIVEIEEGLDGETFFLYVFMAACVVLMLVVGQQFLYSLGRKRVGKKPVVEIGTSNPNDVDYDWLPKETLHLLNKKGKADKSPHAQTAMKNRKQQSPRQEKQRADKSPRAQKATKNQKQQSPRQRKAKRSAGDD